MTDTQFFNSFHCNLYKSKRSYSTQVDSCPFHYFGRLVSGKARIVSEQKELRLQEGDIFFIPKGLRYRSYWNCEDGSVEFYSFGFSMIPLDAQLDLQLQQLVCTPEELVIFGDLEKCDHVSPAFVGELYRFFHAVLPKMAAAPKSRSQRIVDRAADYIRSNPGCSVSEVAQHCKVSECTLFLKFRKHFGKTPVEFRHRILAEKASALLAATDLSVEEISSRLGFSSSSYFRKVLKAETGKTPTQIRKKYRQLL